MKAEVELPIEWGDPPESKRGVDLRRGRRSWDAVADVLRANPGRWARVTDPIKPPTAASVCKTHGLEYVLRADVIYLRHPKDAA